MRALACVLAGPLGLARALPPPVRSLETGPPDWSVRSGSVRRRPVQVTARSGIGSARTVSTLSCKHSIPIKKGIKPLQYSSSARRGRAETAVRRRGLLACEAEMAHDESPARRACRQEACSTGRYVGLERSTAELPRRARHQQAPVGGGSCSRRRKVFLFAPVLSSLSYFVSFYVCLPPHAFDSVRRDSRRS